MAMKDRKSSMVCPCCGQARAVEGEVCAGCGARRVGEPLAAPEAQLPCLGAAFTAIGCALVIAFAFIAVWLFSNDMKVARTLLVWMIGDGLELTRDLLHADPHLPYYRIFSYDAYRLAFYLSFGAIPLSLVGIWLARRALRLVRQDAARFGGRRIARASLALSMLLLVAFSAAAISSIPRAIENGRAKRIAATRTVFYQLDYALRKYRREFGTYPSDPSDLQRVCNEPLPQVDYWENTIRYYPGSLIASKDSPLGFSDYELRSPGPDGIFGTADDIVMRDGMIVTATAETDLPTSLLAPEKPVK